MDRIPAAGIDRSYVFGPFRLLPERQLLLRGGEPVRIGGRALDILVALIERPGETVGKQTLIDLVWPQTYVEEGNLKVNMNALRRALDEGPAAPRYIETVTGHGYRFVGAAQLSGSEEPLPIVEAHPFALHNLPMMTTRVIGRDDAVQTIKVHIETERLVTVVGAGGIGKTTVALAVAEQLVGKRKDGVWLVDLSSVADPALVPSTIATSIGLAAHSTNMQAALGEYLRSRDLVILLDSCEHLVESVALCVEQLLDMALSTRFLVTSRESLGLVTERIFRLPSLSAPAQATDLSVDDAMRFPAVQLFVERAAERVEGFVLAPQDIVDIARICRKLDGLALAIELAATQVDALGISGLLVQLEDRFEILDVRRGGPERHRTLTATIDWSYDLLSDDEKRAMRHLSVFAGAFSLEAALAVLGTALSGRDVVMRSLSGLVLKSLLSGEIRQSEVEYRLLDSTRAYALAKLRDDPENDAILRRHAEYCVGMLASAKADAERLPRSAWLMRYGGRIDDVRSALARELRHGAPGPLAITLTIAAIPFGKQVSLIEECRVAVERALQDDFAPFRTKRDDLVLNVTLGATLLHSRGPLMAVKAALNKALGIAEDLNDVGMQLECLLGLSEYELWTGDARASITVAERIRGLKSQGQETATANADAQTGSALSWLGVLDAARHRLEPIAHRPPRATVRVDAARFDFDQRLTAKGALATVLWLQGYPEKAMAVAREQLAEAEEANYAVSLCYALLHCSLVIAMYVRDYEAAHHHLRRGIEHASRHGLAIWEAMALGPANRLGLYLGRTIDLEHFRDTLALVREGGFRMRYPNYLTNYGEAMARQGDVEKGLAAIDEALELSKATGQVVGIPEILRIKANVIRFQKPAAWRLASDLYEESLEIAHRDQALAWELRSAISLVKLVRTRGGNTAAEDQLSAIYGRFTEGFKTGDLRRARSLLEKR